MSYVVTNHLKYEHFDTIESAVRYLRNIKDPSYVILKEDNFGNLLPVSQSELINATNKIISENEHISKDSPLWPKSVLNAQNQINTQTNQNYNNNINPNNQNNTINGIQTMQNAEKATVVPYVPYPIYPQQTTKSYSTLKLIIFLLAVLFLIILFGYTFSYIIELLKNFINNVNK